MFKKALVLILILTIFKSFVSSDDEIIKNLLNRMTAEEKCGQMTQITIDVIQKDDFGLDEDPVNITRLREAILDYKIGSIQNTPRATAQNAEIWQKILKHIHDESLNTNLKIPLIYGIDSIHGANYIKEATIFPQPLAQAASFNVDMAEKIGEIVAKETRAVGIPWNFSPMLDVTRNIIWSRTWETFGEDVLLVQKMGEHFIKGHQGNDLKNRTKTATCLKHYIGYSMPFNGRDRTPAYIPENLLREYFLPPFESGLKAGSPTVMINSAEVNGLPGHANYHYITEILKNELKFDGFVISDWEDVKRLHTRDKVAETPEEAVRIAVMAGIDISMVPFDYSFFDYCVALYNKHTSFKSRVNDAVERILKVKSAIGYLQHSNSIYPKAEDLALIGAPDHQQVSLEAARESVVLAKNENDVLPLQKNKNILITGPTANLIKVLNGGWSYVWQGDKEEYFQNFPKVKPKTIFEALKDKSSNVVLKEGVDFTDVINLNDVMNAAQSSDYIVLCIGEATYTETPGNIDNMLISESQQHLADKLFEIGKPVIVVYVGGRPRTITSIVKKSHAVLIAFLPGNKGGEAIADIIFGDYNPNGKLPITYPKGPNGAMTYDYKPIEDWEKWLCESNGAAACFDALFSFGHGLSYTKFEYSDLNLDLKTVNEPNSVKGSVKVKNIGNRPGKETVLVYLNDEYGSLSRPNKQLKFFKKIMLEPGQSETINFEITRYDMSFINLKNERIVESGKFNVFVDKLSASFNLIAKEQTTMPPVVVTTTPPVVVSTKSNSSNKLLINLSSLLIVCFITFFNFN